MDTLSFLDRLEGEAIQILRDGVANAERPVLLFSGGKDSTVLAHLALKAFYPSRPPVPLLHVDSTWEFAEVINFRDRFATEHGFRLETWRNEEGFGLGLNPVEHGDTYTTAMRTDALRQALDRGKYDVIFGGARRDEESTRAKERVVSVRGRGHSWDPKNQRAELWNVFNWTRTAEQTLRVYPLSNWTEFDLWMYILTRDVELCPLYYAAERPVVVHGGQTIVVDNAEAAAAFGFPAPRNRTVRFRSLGCWPVTAAADSDADTIEKIVAETLSSRRSERSGRVSDAGSLEAQKRQGYF